MVRDRWPGGRVRIDVDVNATKLGKAKSSHTSRKETQASFLGVNDITSPQTPAQTTPQAHTYSTPTVCLYMRALWSFSDRRSPAKHVWTTTTGGSSLHAPLSQALTHPIDQHSAVPSC